tara:strand:+ start:1293 stop:1721 length:429 start_codon:yes stop_codon:yes gene_type:complete
MDPTVVGGAIIGIVVTMVGTEVLKTKIMQWIFPTPPPPPPIFTKEEKKLFYLMKVKLDRLPEDSPTLTKEEHEALLELKRVHDAIDDDGIPLWYVPRSWHKTHEENLKVTQEIAFAQKETAKALDGVFRVIERLADKVADLK